MPSGAKLKVYFNEFNVVMEHAAYLPLVSGLLRGYAETFPQIRDHYSFMPFLFLRQEPEAIVAGYEDPAVASFSVSMWNEQYNLEVAARLRERFPECLIVFGGPQVPHYPAAYMAEYGFIDVAVRGEGERPFADVLTRALESRDFSGIPNIAWRNRDSGETVRNDGENKFEKDLDLFPSPYLRGYYEDLFEEHKEVQFQAIIETNRGCPFLCAFCYWGQGGLSLKFRWHSLDRLREEIEWCAKHQIRYVFNADSNFGMHKRDADIARMLVETKKKFGYPEKFRTCFGKNTDERIFEVGNILHQHKMEKGITLSRQSMDEGVLENIERSNIKLSTYKNLQERFNELEIPVYTELILGLPGETYTGWMHGIEELLQSGLKSQLFIYPCQVLPNTTLADPEYQAKFGVRMSRIPLSEIHGSVRRPEEITEYEDIIVQTDAMSEDDWRKAIVFSWVTMTLHSLKLGFFALMYVVDRYHVRYADVLQYISECRMPEGAGEMVRREVRFFEGKADDIISSREKACIMPEFGPIYWDVEEASFLRLAGELDVFYQDFQEVLECFLEEREILFDREELSEAMRYQRMRISSWQPTDLREWTFQHNFPEYFDARHHGREADLRRESQIMTLREPKDFKGDRIHFAREVTLWGRKSDAIMEPVTWRSADPKAIREATVSTVDQ